MGLFQRRREQLLLQHKARMNWTLTASIMLSGHELMEAEYEGFNADEQSMRAMTIRSAVLDEIGGLDVFAHTLAEEDFLLKSRDPELAFERALDSTGYVEARRRLFPPGTEIKEYGEAFFKSMWTGMMADYIAWSSEGDQQEAADLLFKKLLIAFLISRSNWDHDDPEGAALLKDWYPTHNSIDSAIALYMGLKDQGNPPSKEATTDAVRRVESTVTLDRDARSDDT
jgi:hypothetical protein